MTPQDASIQRIMTINRDMNRDEVIAAAIRKELDAAYIRGFKEATRRYKIHRKDMGR